MSRRYCEQCGAGLATGQRYCESCGAPVARGTGDAAPVPVNTRPILPGRRGTGVLRVQFLAVAITGIVLLAALLLLGEDGPVTSTLGSILASPSPPASQRPAAEILREAIARTRSLASATQTFHDESGATVASSTVSGSRL